MSAPRKREKYRQVTHRGPPLQHLNPSPLHTWRRRHEIDRHGLLHPNNLEPRFTIASVYDVNRGEHGSFVGANMFALFYTPLAQQKFSSSLLLLPHKNAKWMWMWDGTNLHHHSMQQKKRV